MTSSLGSTEDPDLRSLLANFEHTAAAPDGVSFCNTDGTTWGRDRGEEPKKTLRKKSTFRRYGRGELKTVLEERAPEASAFRHRAGQMNTDNNVRDRWLIVAGQAQSRVRPSAVQKEARAVRDSLGTRSPVTNSIIERHTSSGVRRRPCPTTYDVPCSWRAGWTSSRRQTR